MKNYFKLEDVADVKLSNVDKKVKTGEKEIRLCNYTDVYKNTYIDKNRAVNFMMASCNEKEFEKFLLKKGQVSITKDSEKANDIGVSTYIEEDFQDVVLGYHLALITPYKEKLDGKYLNYWFNTSQAKRYFENNVGGSGQRFTLPLDVILSTPLCLPNIEKQKKISSILFSLDKKIQLLHQINDNLAELAKTIYDYWFVQFDFPDENGKPYKTSGGKMFYNEVLKREIPEGWEVCTFSNFIKDIKNGDWGKEQEEGNYTEKVSCIRGADINGLNGNGELKSPIRYINEKNKCKILVENDFIIEISGGSPTQSTGRIALLTSNTFARFKNNIICSNFCKAISLKDEKYTFFFLKEWERLYYNNILFSFEGKTSGIKNFLFEAFIHTYPIISPQKSIIEKYNFYNIKVDENKQKNLQQIQHFRSLRDWLLPMLMNGQISVE